MTLKEKKNEKTFSLDLILARNGAIHKFFLVGFLFFNVCKGRGTSTEELFCSYYLSGSHQRVWFCFFFFFLFVLCQFLLSCHDDRRHSFFYFLFFFWPVSWLSRFSFDPVYCRAKGLQWDVSNLKKNDAKACSRGGISMPVVEGTRFWELTAKKKTCGWVKMHDKGKRHDIPFDNSLIIRSFETDRVEWAAWWVINLNDKQKDRFLLTEVGFTMTLRTW